MIITKEVEKHGKIIKVDNLPKGSHILVEVECDIWEKSHIQKLY